eukprot:gene24178-32984_t
MPWTEQQQQEQQQRGARDSPRFARFVDAHGLRQWLPLLRDAGIRDVGRLADALAADRLPSGIPLDVRRTIWLHHVRDKNEGQWETHHTMRDTQAETC